MAKPIDVTPDEFHAEVLECDMPVVVDFWSETCGHCLAFNPHYDESAEANEGKVKFVKVAMGVGRGLFSEYQVRATPTVIMFNQGEEVARTVGSKHAHDLNDWIAENLPG